MTATRSVWLLLGVAALVAVSEVVMLVTGYIPAEGFHGVPTQHFVVFAVLHGLGCGCALGAVFPMLLGEANPS